MSGMIIIAGLEAASNTDILQSTLLQSIPENGWLMFEMQSSDNDATNSGVVSIQLPDNSQPLNAVRVPGTATASLAGIIDERLALKVRFQITQGGKCTFSYTETGVNLFSWRVIFKPFR